MGLWVFSIWKGSVWSDLHEYLSTCDQMRVFAFFKVIILLIIYFFQSEVLIINTYTLPEYSLFFQLSTVFTKVMDHDLEHFRNSSFALVLHYIINYILVYLKLRQRWWTLNFTWCHDSWTRFLADYNIFSLLCWIWGSARWISGSLSGVGGSRAFGKT